MALDSTQAADVEEGKVCSNDEPTLKGHKAGEYTKQQRVGSALFFSISSLMVIFMNKAIMTNYGFKQFNFLATTQFFATFVALSFLAVLGKVDIPRISIPVVKEILPISLMFLGNIISGLGGTRNLSLPMFTVLRRFSIMFTMLAEWYVLSSKPTDHMVYAVAMMIGGSSIAASFDFSWDVTGYVLVMLNNIFTALNGVYMKKAQTSDLLKKNNMAILYFNSAFSAFFMILYFIVEAMLVAQRNSSAVLLGSSGTGITEGILHLAGGNEAGGVEVAHRMLMETGEEQAAHGLGVLNMPETPPIAGLEESSLSVIAAYPGWSDSTFVVMFLTGALLGSVLNYSIFLCTQYNSALTTAVIGCLKNVATSYLGMVLFPDFVFSMPNFIGINISIAGSLYFTYYTLYLKNKAPAAKN